MDLFCGAVETIGLPMNHNYARCSLDGHSFRKSKGYGLCHLANWGFLADNHPGVQGLSSQIAGEFPTKLPDNGRKVFQIDGARGHFPDVFAVFANGTV